MKPKQFLFIVGLLLFLFGMLGSVGILGPTADKSIFHSIWWFDGSENFADIIVGMSALFAAFAFSVLWQKYFSLLLGIASFLFGIYSVVSSTPVLGANLENPADSILHLLIGAWGVYVSYFLAK